MYLIINYLYFCYTFLCVFFRGTELRESEITVNNYVDNFALPSNIFSNYYEWVRSKFCLIVIACVPLSGFDSLHRTANTNLKQRLLFQPSLFFPPKPRSEIPFGVEGEMFV